MRDDAAELAVKLAGVVITAGIYAVFSLLSTSSDIPKNPDGTCDLSAPHKVTFNTYRDCGKNCTRTTKHAFSVHQTRDKGEDMVVHINQVRNRETTRVSTEQRILDFSYVAGGRTLEASWSSQDNLLGYKFKPQTGGGDISAFSSAPYGSDKAYQRGYKEGVSLIKQIESRAGCKMPYPSQPGVGGAAPGAW